MTAESVLDAARAAGLRLATAESCTGGMVAAALTDTPGSSDVVLGGIVAYANPVKVGVLGVSQATLRIAGAVSEETAREMAVGACRATGAEIAVSTTGIAGPGGGSAEKPEGRVCFGLCTPEGTRSETVDFGALGRAEVRRATVEHALAMILAHLRS